MNHTRTSAFAVGIFALTLPYCATSRTGAISAGDPAPSSEVHSKDPGAGPSCGASTCANGQICVFGGCCEGYSACIRPSDSGACPIGLVPTTCNGGPGCAAPSCKPSSFCVDAPSACGANLGCACLAGLCADTGTQCGGYDSASRVLRCGCP